MGLKQVKPIDRIFFLQEFVSQLVMNSARDARLKQVIEAEKIKRKYVEPELGEPNLPSEIFEPEPTKFQKSTMPEPIVKPSIREIKLPRKITHPTIQPKPIRSLPSQTQQPIQPIPSTQSTTPGTEIETSLKKIESLIKDPSVQMIECPGPGKNILVKVRNRINTTKITMGEDEIKSIINYFSKTAKIPISGGILKAALNNLLISAVVSEYVGSRFIINRKSPYELIEGV